MATLQAISGAGYPGVASMDINANVIPYIGGEEEKMQSETQKILGDWGQKAGLDLHERPPKLEFKVQYGESDYDFLRRTLVDAGISYSFAFDRESQTTRLVLSDAPERRKWKRRR